MYDNYNYPPGADTPDAPWNQVEPPETDFEVTVSNVLEKICTITTDDVYYDDGDWLLCEDADVQKAYDYAYASIPEMLGELVKYVDAELETCKDRKRRQELRRIKDSASDWEIVEERIDS